MIPSKLKRLVYAVLVSFSTPIVVQANDISLHFSLAPVPAEEKVTEWQLPPYDLASDYPSSSPPQIDNLWDRIRQGFAIPDLESALAAGKTDWYSARPDYFERTLNRASRYLYHVVEELEKRNMPTEIALLPFVESSFDPLAVSSAQAAGMWQFIPSTGRFYNLKQNSFRDERRDIVASTDAALTYLQKLYDMFGDWHLALAAYNWGEGSVQRAISKARARGVATDFNSLSRFMPDETRNYVPKLQAVKNIIAAPERYAIALPKLENQPYFVTITKTRDIDVKLAAQLAEMSMEEFRALNPQFKRPVITGGPDTQILLPQSNAEKFKANLAKWTRALSSWTLHRITNAREKIETIAVRFKTTPEVIREANNLPPNVHLKAGSAILVPRVEHVAAQDITREVADAAVVQYEPAGGNSRKVVVKVGKRDTLSSIARRHKVSVAQIKAWNDLKRGTIARGQTLELFVPQKAGQAKRTRSTRMAQKRSSVKTVAARRASSGKAVVAANNKSR